MASLLSRPVELCDWRAGDHEGYEVHELERRWIEDAVPARRDDFLRGRTCARRALRRLGSGDEALLPGQDRAPVWPSGMVGSITHTKDYCAAAVALSKDILAIGIDAERIDAVAPNLWGMVMRQRELADLEALPGIERLSRAALTFSAKESFFKATFPISRQMLEFHHVEVNFRAGGFIARIVDLAGQRSSPSSAVGRYCVSGGLALTAVVIPAGDASTPMRTS